MPEPESSDREWMRQALHDLAQPLTAMECRLYLGILSGGGEPEAADLVATVREALVECERLMELVRSMQDRLRPNETPTEDKENAV